MKILKNGEWVEGTPEECAEAKRLHGAVRPAPRYPAKVLEERLLQGFRRAAERLKKERATREGEGTR